jgi:hypothetical protein
MVTSVAPTRFEPVIVIEVPPASGPETGETEPTSGTVGVQPALLPFTMTGHWNEPAPTGVNTFWPEPVQREYCRKKFDAEEGSFVSATAAPAR